MTPPTAKPMSPGITAPVRPRGSRAAPQPMMIAAITVHSERSRSLVASRALVDWRRHTLVSVTLWDDLDSVYSMGSVHAHVAASRLPPRMGVRTACGIFCFVGDWRRVMFGAPHEGRSPLRPLAQDEPVAR